MCGISGVLYRPGERIAPELAREMADAMRHRGPDSGGSESLGNLALGHRRLSVLDLSAAGNQPMRGEDGASGVVFNGEIYNYRELRLELEREGARFNGSSDTEVALRALERWGERAFARFNGMFAIGFWRRLDGGRHAVWIARDRFGVKPLFYAARDGRVAFASELKPLLKLDWVSREVDRESLFHFLKFSHVPGRRSILAGVRQLEPGRWMRFEDGPEGARVAAEGAFHDPLAHAVSGARAAVGERRSEGELVDELERLVAQAVRRQLVSDVPVGCFLSGGIDSTLLALQFSELSSGEPLRTFTVGYREGEWDEASSARSFAERLGAKHVEKTVVPADLFLLLPSIPEFFDQPFADPSLLPTMLLCELARKDVTVALSGDGGDELFFGYEQHLALHWLFRLGVHRMPRALRSATLRPLGKLLGGLGQHRLEKLSEILEFRDEAELVQYFIGTIGPLRLDRIASLLVDPPAQNGALLAPLVSELRRQGLGPSARVEHLFQRTFLVDTVLAKTDRASMAYGLEARVPYLDNDLADFTARLPLEWKLRGGVSKYLLRKLLERKLRARGAWSEAEIRDIVSRPKKGFGVPLREWWRGDLQYLLDEYLDPARLKREGLFVPERVSQLVRGHLEHGQNHAHILWSLVSFQMWRERYL